MCGDDEETVRLRRILEDHELCPQCGGILPGTAHYYTGNRIECTCPEVTP